MKKVRSALAALLVVLPFAGVAALEQIADVTAAAEQEEATIGAAPSQRCCWVYYLGMWWCLPC